MTIDEAIEKLKRAVIVYDAAYAMTEDDDQAEKFADMADAVELVTGEIMRLRSLGTERVKP